MTLTFRPARIADLPELVALLADDPLGATRELAEAALDPAYVAAFEAIARDPNNELIVLDEGDRCIGQLQLTFIPSLTRTGAWRCQIEGVRIHRDHRGGGLGERAMHWAIDRARARGCQLVQLTSDKQRADALRFYQRLGFEATHEGFKRSLSQG